MAADRIFVDTNVLVYANQIRSSSHARAERALAAIADSDATPCLSRQVLREYYSAVTRPQTDGPALDPETAARRVEVFLDVFEVLDENARTLTRLLDPGRRYQFSGEKVHDANIVATMLEAGVSRLLTANPSDFRRFADLISIEPL